MALIRFAEVSFFGAGVLDRTYAGLKFNLLQVARKEGLCFMQNEWSPVRRICINCGQALMGYRNDSGLVKLQCPKCGLVMVSKKISRRHERIMLRRRTVYL